MVEEAVKKYNEAEAEKLWARYRENATKENRNKLVMYYLPYVKALAVKIIGRLPRNTVDLNDLVNAGIFGLVDAIEKFDESKGIKFSAYSYLKINGAILDELRKLDCVSYISRSLAEEVETAYEELSKKYGREPHIEELAEYLKMDISKVEEGLAIISRINLGGKKYFHIKDPKTGNFMELTELLEDKSVNIEKNLLCETLKKYVKETFSTFEQLIFTLYFESDLTLTQIGKMFDYSPSRISAIFNQMMLKLRNHIRLLLERYKRA